ncbi:unnamed protein product [Ectocarpus sp. 12 AP-2014]
MATRGDAVQAAQETARLTISTAAKAVANGVITVGAATSVVAPLCVALLEAKGVVHGASRTKEELMELCERCELITVQVIDTAKASTLATSMIDVSPLVECIEISRWWPSATMIKGAGPGWRNFAETATTSRGFANASTTSLRLWGSRVW